MGAPAESRTLFSCLRNRRVAVYASGAGWEPVPGVEPGRRCLQGSAGKAVPHRQRGQRGAESNRKLSLASGSSRAKHHCLFPLYERDRRESNPLRSGDNRAAIQQHPIPSEEGGGVEPLRLRALGFRDRCRTTATSPSSRQARQESNLLDTAFGERPAASASRLRWCVPPQAVQARSSLQTAERRRGEFVRVVDGKGSAGLDVPRSLTAQASHPTFVLVRGFEPPLDTV